MIELRVKLFGAFRKYGNGRELVLALSAASGIRELRSALVERLRELDPGFSDGGLIDDSAFADESAVLSPDTRFERSCAIAVLPPVCGG